MKAITIRQPYAALIAEGLKEYEFRTWKTSYRGEVLIHAGKGADRQAMERFEGLGLAYPSGCLIARALLTDCVAVDDKLREALRRENFAVYEGTTENAGWQGYAFRLERIQKIAPIPAKGKLGLWEYRGPAFIND